MRHAFLVVTTLVFTIGALVAPAAVGAAPAPGQRGPSAAYTPNGSFCADAEEVEFLRLINEYRAQNGRPQLALTQTLGDAAEHHSNSMADHNYFSHDLGPERDPDGTVVTWSENMTKHGYTYSTYRGENIAAGNATASATFTQWRNSVTHNNNMLNTNFRAIGIGRADNANTTYKWYWTTDFGGVVDAAARVCGGPAPSPSPSPAPSASPSPPPGSTPFRIVSSGRTSNSNSSTYAKDGNPATAWYTTVSTPPASAYVYFDLGSAKSIGAVKWLWSQTGSADNVLIQVSSNRSTWTTLTTIGNAAAGQWQTFTTRTTARYVRFYFTNPNSDPRLGYLAEVQIFP